jgi:surface polysaccharide O-acyltransferase-like enzyme
VLGARFENLSQRLARLLTGWKLVLLPLAVLGLARIVLVARFPSTHALGGDWYNHAMYFFLFLLGAMMARQRDFWERLDAMRWGALGIALACWALLKIYFSLPDQLVPAATMAWLQPLQRVVYALCQWSAIVAACGFAHRHLQFDSEKRRYLAQAVFPVYIVHQTLIVSIAHGLKPLRFAPGIEGILLLVLTVTLSFAIFEMVRRCAPLRPLFGLGREDRQTVEAAPEPARA